jgi:RNA polymerase sigma-70 factor (sigma-E family)
VPTRSDRDAEFTAYVRDDRAALLRTAIGLTSGDHDQAEDLVQATLTKLYLVWPRARRANMRAYARRTLVNTFLDHTRRPFRRREIASAVLPHPVGHDEYPSDGSGRVVAALAALPPRMRAAIVLRHVDGLSVEQAADALGCRIGTVKSQTARGLAKLREVLEEPVATTRAASAHPTEGDTR